MKILVTGASGLIGKEIFDTLTNSGYDVTGTSYRSSLNTNFISVDLSSKEAFGNKLAGLHFDLIIHCAATLPLEMEAAEASIINKKIDDCVYSYCQVHDTRLVYMSGLSVTVEDESYRSNPYIQQKRESEILFLKLDQCLVLRVTSPYGPFMKNRTVLKLFVEKAIKDEEIIIFGSGTRTQDFVHVSDISSLILKVIHSKNTGIYNLGSGTSISMLNLATKIIETLKSKSQIILRGEDSQEKIRFEVNINKTSNDFDWSPKVSLDLGIRKIAESLK